jgi:GDP-mannose 6-dehydrogenase
VGLTFKPGTDDLRESKAVEFAEVLVGKGYDLRIFESRIAQGSIHGSNLRYIEKSIPHIWKLLTADFEQVIRESEVVVLLEPLDSKMRKALRLFRPGQVCFDFVRTLKPEDLPEGEYRSLTFDPHVLRTQVAKVA